MNDDQTTTPTIIARRPWTAALERWMHESSLDEGTAKVILETAERDCQELIDNQWPPMAGVLVSLLTAAIIASKTDQSGEWLQGLMRHQMPLLYDLARRLQDDHGDTIEDIVARGGFLERVQ